MIIIIKKHTYGHLGHFTFSSSERALINLTFTSLIAIQLHLKIKKKRVVKKGKKGLQ